MTGSNLMPKHRIEAWRVRRCANAWAMSLLTVAVLVGGLVIGAFMTKAQPKAMPVGLSEKLELDRSDLALVEEQLRQLDLAEDARRRAMSVPHWDALLGVIASELDGDARIQAFRTERASGASTSWTVSIVGVAFSTQAPSTIARRLEATRLFSSVRPSLGAVQSQRQDGRPEFNFQIDCVIAPGASP